MSSIVLRLKRIVSIGLLCSLSLLADNTRSEERLRFEFVENYAVVSGWLRFPEAFILAEELKRKSVRGVIFDNCTGGELGPFRVLRRAIYERRLSTKARGVVGSACALAFLAGTLREFDNTTPSEIFLHGAYNIRADGGYDLASESIEELATYIVDRTGGKFRLDIAKVVVSIPDIRDGLTIYASPRDRLGVPVSMLFCDRTRKIYVTDCAALGGADALSTGIITAAH